MGNKENKVQIASAKFSLLFDENGKSK